MRSRTSASTPRAATVPAAAGDVAGPEVPGRPSHVTGSQLAAGFTDAG